MDTNESPGEVGYGEHGQLGKLRFGVVSLTKVKQAAILKDDLTWPLLR